MGESSKLLGVLVQTDRTLGCKVKATARTGVQNHESFVEVSRVPEETPAAVVAGVPGRQLVPVIGKRDNWMNVWLEEETFKMLASDVTIAKPLRRKAIAQTLREENKQIKNGKRYLKYRRQAKVRSFIFDVVGAAEAERL